MALSDYSDDLRPPGEIRWRVLRFRGFFNSRHSWRSAIQKRHIIESPTACPPVGDGAGKLNPQAEP